MMKAPSTTAGMNPARNRADTEALAIEAITIMRMQGGTSIPIADAADTIATACSDLKPARRIGGIIVEPMADTSAMVEPDNPEKMYSATTTAIPMPPRIHPTSA